MRKATKLSLIIAASLMVVGMLLFSVVMSIKQWDFTMLSTGKYISNSYEISDGFNNLSIGTDTADIIFALSDNGICKVECYEKEQEKHCVSVKEDTLCIQMTDERSWYDYIGIDFVSPRITVYLPKTEYTSLLIKGSTGNVELNGCDATEIYIETETGNVAGNLLSDKVFITDTATGKIDVPKTITGGLCEINTSTGNIKFSID